MNVQRSQYEADLEREVQVALRNERMLYGEANSATLPAMDVVDAKIAAAEARVDTEFAKLRGELQRLPGKATIWASAGSLFLGVLAVLSFGGDRLALGLGQADARQQQLQRDQAQDTTARETSHKLDELLKRIPAKP